MNICIIGSALSGNKGAAAMLEATVQTFLADDDRSTFTLLSLFPERDRARNSFEQLTVVDCRPLVLLLMVIPAAFLYRILPFTRKWMRCIPAVGALADADVLLEQGGITFCDGREFFLIYNVASVLPALFMNVKIVKCAQALGPFNSPLNRWAAKRILPRMSLIVARGESTCSHLRDLGLGNIVPGADYSLALEIDAAARGQAEQLLPAGGPGEESPTVSLCPSVVVEKQCRKQGIDYLAALLALVRHLQAGGYRVLIIPHSACASGGKGHVNDVPLVRKIADSLADHDGVHCIGSELDSQVLRALIGATDLLVASRFHAMVSGLAMEVPTLVVGWSHKYAEVLNSFGIREHCLAFHELQDKELIVNEFGRLAANKELYAEKIRSRLPGLKELAREHVDLVKRVISESSADGSSTCEPMPPAPNADLETGV